MTLEQLHRLNEKFQQRASEIAELLPGSNLLAFSSSMIRSARKIDGQLQRVLTAKTESGFYVQIENLEEEMDELIFILDRLDEANRKHKITLITDFVKRGYEILSLYSICCDQLLERKLKRKGELE